MTLAPAPLGNSTPRQSRWSVIGAVAVPIASTATGLLDAASQSLRLITTLAIAGALAFSLGTGLYVSGQVFREAVQSTRHAVRSSSTPKSLSKRLRTSTRNSQTARQQLQQDLDAFRKMLSLEKRPSDQQRTTANK